MACPDITVIDKTECIGNSLVTINSNFQTLRDSICSIQTGIAIQKNGAEISINTGTINFTGDGVTVTRSTNQITNVNIPVIKTPKVSKLEEQGLNSGGGNNNFFILNDGTIRVTGANTNGELGVGRSNVAALTPLMPAFNPPLQPGEYVDKLYTQFNNTYVITTKGRLYGCGLNNTAQIGLGRSNINGYDFTTGAPLPGAKGMAGVPVFTFINVLGETNNPPNFDNISVNYNPAPGYKAAALDPVISFASGSGASSTSISLFAVTASGNLYAWGANKNGQLGIPVTQGTVINVPTRVTSFAGTAQYVTAGGNNNGTTTFVVDANRKLWVCGRNVQGQAGILNNTVNITTFTYINNLPLGYNVNNVRVGGSADRITAYVTLNDGTLWAAGFNQSGGADGNGTRAGTRGGDSPRSSWSRIEGFFDNEYVEDVVAHVDTNSITAWALIRSGEYYNIKGWGNNRFGQLGTTTNYNNDTGVAVTDANTANWPWVQAGALVKQVVVAGNQNKKTTLVLDTNNNLWSAGFALGGLIGNGYNYAGRAGSARNQFTQVFYNQDLGTPVAIRSTNNDRFVSAKNTLPIANFLVLLDTGKVLAWGYDAAGIGQLGVDYSPNITTLPMLVQILQ
jgi:alpha-tubulin suppressor-like RCC1 family protein